MKRSVRPQGRSKRKSRDRWDAPMIMRAFEDWRLSQACSYPNRRHPGQAASAAPIRDPFLSMADLRSGMDPGSALRSARDDGAFR